MLSETSYHVALAIYLGAGVLAVLLLAWWLLRRWPGFPSLLLVLLCAALLLTPAYPRDGVSTLAPAAIVAGFQMSTEGVGSAQHALRPLAAAALCALLLALLLRFTLFRRRRAAPSGAAGESR